MTSIVSRNDCTKIFQIEQLQDLSSMCTTHQELEAVTWWRVFQSIVSQPASSSTDSSNCRLTSMVVVIHIGSACLATQAAAKGTCYIAGHLKGEGEQVKLYLAVAGLLSI